VTVTAAAVIAAITVTVQQTPAHCGRARGDTLLYSESQRQLTVFTATAQRHRRCYGRGATRRVGCPGPAAVTHAVAVRTGYVTNNLSHGRAIAQLRQWLP
jgi:hypothetical protein